MLRVYKKYQSSMKVQNDISFFQIYPKNINMVITPKLITNVFLSRQRNVFAIDQTLKSKYRVDTHVLSIFILYYKY
jgi:hypothetical protein